MAKEDAMSQYVEKMDEVDPGWLDRVDLSSGEDGGEKCWVSVSSLAKEQADRDVQIEDEAKTVCDWIKEGNVRRSGGFVFVPFPLFYLFQVIADP